MKKMLWISVFIICLITFFAACKNRDYKQSYDTNGVLDLIAAKELPCEVLDINVVKKGQNYTGFCVELYVPETECSTNKYFCSKEYDVPPGIKDILTDYGIKNDSIANLGINYKDFIVETKNSIEYRPYYIYWFKLKEPLQNKCNVLVYTSVPHEITIDNTR